MQPHYRIALAGNPNCGKTTIFNELTGMNQHVGNWPGKTVEKKTGYCRFRDQMLEIVDLPGTYSLSAFTQEEIIARDFIIHAQPDVVVCVIDATNLERNLFLTVQVRELGVPVVVAMNMADLLKFNGMVIDTEKLATALGIPVIYTAANRGEGVEELLEAVLETAINNSGRPIPEPHPHHHKHHAERFENHDPIAIRKPQLRHSHQGRQRRFPSARRRMEHQLNRHSRQHMLAYTHLQEFSVDYGREIEQEIVEITHVLEQYPKLEAEFPTRWLAIKLLEQDSEIDAHVREVDQPEPIFTVVEHSLHHLRSIYGDDVDTMIADRRYGWINGLMREVIMKTSHSRLAFSDSVDKIVTHKFFGFVIFFFFMWVVFKASTDLATPFIDFIEGTLAGPITQWTLSVLNGLNLQDSWITSFLTDGVIGGVGGVLSFIPVLFFLYLTLAILEDSGYMARAAFLMDKTMHSLGLHGKSFLPMVLGFGCTVPALYGTRTERSQRDRVLVGLLAPFMSCSAKLPVYVIIATIFFPRSAGLVIFSLYGLGVLTAFVLGLILKKTAFKEKEDSPFVMELPPYHVPTLKSIWLHTWERTSAFIKKAWTVILVASIVIWLLLAIPVNSPEASFNDVAIEESAFARLSQFFAPALKPTGFGSWESAGALITGVWGKEIVVSTYAQIYNLSDGSMTVEEVPFLNQLAQIGIDFVAAILDTIRSIPLVIGINLFEDGEVDEASALSAAMRADFEQISGGHGALAAYSLLVFVLYYTPCLIALNAERQELGFNYMLITAFGQLLLAWVMSTIIFQGGVLLGIG
ncbi:MAG: ferrous iron transport protein B [Anaerolineae bacterium]|jgi:ferrous iron transport protein B|nr:ferrous iron transport protein B [Anaerolineae bacterium]